MTLLLSEEKALKTLLEGVTVVDAKDNARPVKVWFDLPEPELRTMSYPSIVIQFVNLREATERAHRGPIDPAYLPDSVVAAASGFTNRSYEFPTPIDLDYLISTFTRSVFQDRQITAQLLGGRLPLRFGQLTVDDDSTVRRLDLLSWQSADTVDEDNKRLFRKQFYIRISAELFPEQVQAIQQATEVDFTLNTPPTYEVFNVSP